MNTIYEDFDKLTESFLHKNDIDIFSELCVDGVVYLPEHSRGLTTRELLFEKHAPMETFIDVEGNNRIVFVWRLNENNTIIPVSCITHSVVSTSINETINLSFNEPVTIDGINGNQPIDAKIDTGADVCSLHATDIKINGDSVSFNLNNRSYSMNVVKTHSIKQADSNAQPRPVILLTFLIAGKQLTNVECNLNDRSGMSSLLLIGRNLLDKGDFSIRTGNNISTEQWIEYDTTISQPINESSDCVHVTDKELIKLLKNSTLTLKELFEIS